MLELVNETLELPVDVERLHDVVATLLIRYHERQRARTPQ